MWAGSDATECVVELAGDIGLEGAEDFALSLALCEFALVKDPCAGIHAEAVDGHDVDGPVEGAVAAGVDTERGVGAGLPAHWGTAGIGGEVIVIGETTDASGFGEDCRRDDWTDTAQIEELWGGCLHGRLHLPLERLGGSLKCGDDFGHRLVGRGYVDALKRHAIGRELFGHPGIRPAQSLQA